MYYDYYIGENDSPLPQCNQKQEFPNGPSDKCLKHALKDHFKDKEQ